MKLPTNYDNLSPIKRKAVREEYIHLQDNKCYHCGNPLNEKPSQAMMNKSINTKLFPPNFFYWPIHLHHSHETGMTIGAVHARCNAILWQYHGE